MRILNWIILLIGFSVFGQVEYEFDTVYLYEGEIQNVNKECIKVTRHFFVKNGSPDYFLVINNTDGNNTIAIFRDNKQGLIAEFEPPHFVLDAEVVFNSSIETLVQNNYRNPLAITNVSKREEILDGSIKRYIYQVDRGKKFRNTIYGIDVDTLKQHLPLGVGFGDYYSLFPLGDYQPKGLVLETYTNEGAEIILSNSSLKKTKYQKLVLRFL